jgi:hypothetical protein
VSTAGWLVGPVIKMLCVMERDLPALTTPLHRMIHTVFGTMVLASLPVEPGCNVVYVCMCCFARLIPFSCLHVQLMDGPMQRQVCLSCLACVELLNHKVQLHWYLMTSCFSKETSKDCTLCLFEQQHVMSK